MVVPIILNITVINETIICCNTVLDIKDLGINICVSSINEVEKYELESCLEIIFKNKKTNQLRFV